MIVIHESIILARRHHDRFENPLTTAAAIDRVVHHSLMIEFGADIPSMRAEAAAQRQRATVADPPRPAAPADLTPTAKVA
jgi:hypothetical protein